LHSARVNTIKRFNSGIEAFLSTLPKMPQNLQRMFEMLKQSFENLQQVFRVFFRQNSGTHFQIIFHRGALPRLEGPE
jgi:hypothetical protein